MFYIKTERLDRNRVRVLTPSELDIILFANEQVPVDRASLQEVMTLSGITDSIKGLNGIDFFGDYHACLHRARLTPDFHKGAGIPIGTVLDADGFVLPKCAGSDVGCVDADTEYLSPNGWRAISEYSSDDLVMQYDPASGMGEWVRPSAYIKAPCEEFFHFRTKYGINQMLSDEHRVLCWHEGNMRVITALELAMDHDRLVLGSKVKFETTFTPKITTELALSDAELRVHVMVLADGTLRSKGRVDINVKKDRKITRCRQLLQEADVPFQEWNMKSGATTIRFAPPIYTKACHDLWTCSLAQLKVVADECLKWDGNDDQQCFYTRDKSMADFVHYAFTATGRRGVLRDDIHRDGKHDYRVFAYDNRRVGIAGHPKTPVERVPSIDGFKYCFTVPSGFWVMRRGGNIVMTGNCGMRLIVTDIRREDFDRLSNLDAILRYRFFEGGRDVPLSEANRAAMLRDGVIGLTKLSGGLWDRIDTGKLYTDLERTHRFGHWPTDDLWEFENYARGSGGISYDSSVATIGGGNHFVEMQVVDECIDKQTCWRWGIKPGFVTIMVHTGSVGLGASVGDHFVKAAHNLYPAELGFPGHEYLPLPTVGPHAMQGAAYLSAMGLAANFANVNRVLLGEVALRCLSEAMGREVAGHLVYDAPHNLVWSEGQRHVHRKGATPAEVIADDPIFADGHPVIVPGSMGDASYVLKGLGAVASLCSAPHGAGRKTARGTGRKAVATELEPLRIVTKIDLRTVRRDVAAEYEKDLMEESPSHYKPVLPVIDTVAGAGIANPVARLWPLLTIKA